MKYDDPKLRELLAGRYVLGTMPRRARARFDRLIAEDAVFCAEVRDWAEMFAPLDRTAAPEAPPPRVWRAIEAQLGPAPRASASAVSWLDSLRLWRAGAGFAAAVAVALLIYIGVVGLRPAAPLPNVVAVLLDKDGAPAWIARSGEDAETVTVAALGRRPLDARHSFELWAIAGGAPRPLGLLSPRPDHGLVVAASAVPTTGGVLAISLEPAGGSPSGAPTGPVLFQGKVFSNPL
ncbi:MAG TPA: anti-sigma factor [Stellaceae bacterium]|jgi:anti-sigma-K factor RskA|nr:anti-sigma factor [Stellaceae bacterium]